MALDCRILPTVGPGPSHYLRAADLINDTPRTCHPSERAPPAGSGPVPMRLPIDRPLPYPAAPRGNRGPIPSCSGPARDGSGRGGTRGCRSCEVLAEERVLVPDRLEQRPVGHDLGHAGDPDLVVVLVE